MLGGGDGLPFWEAFWAAGPLLIGILLIGVFFIWFSNRQLKRIEEGKSGFLADFEEFSKEREGEALVKTIVDTLKGDTSQTNVASSDADRILKDAGYPVNTATATSDNPFGIHPAVSDFVRRLEKNYDDAQKAPDAPARASPPSAKTKSDTDEFWT